MLNLIPNSWKVRSENKKTWVQALQEVLEYTNGL